MLLWGRRNNPPRCRHRVTFLLDGCCVKQIWYVLHNALVALRPLPVGIIPRGEDARSVVFLKGTFYVEGKIKRNALHWSFLGYGRVVLKN
jgi:hypothetical protein